MRDARWGRSMVGEATESIGWGREESPQRADFLVAVGFTEGER
jgi:hypothetical protein